MGRTFRVGTRRSQLATTQTGHVVKALQDLHPGLAVDIVEILTKGDRIQDVALSKVGGKGLFISELEEALLQGRVDFAVHSLKDVPAELAPGLVIGAVPRREDPHDLLITREGYTITTLPERPRIGTSSLRRSAQILRLRPDAQIEPLRGNIDTRLRRLQDQAQLDGIVLAAAGLMRMGWWAPDHATTLPSGLGAVLLTEQELIPAVGQGALCIECRATDEELLSLLQGLHDREADATTRAERAFLKAVGGSCQVPVAGYATMASAPSGNGRVVLRGWIGSPDGQQMSSGAQSGEDPERLGRELGEHLLATGGRAILDQLSC